jgi:S-adenosylmethionine decarboxylase
LNQSAYNAFSFAKTACKAAYYDIFGVCGDPGMLDKNKKEPNGEPPVFALGRQLTLEYYDCGVKALLDKVQVENALLKAANDSGATIISSSFHQFEPQGISGVVIIAESHFTIHAWPEHNYAAVDIFTCGDNIHLDEAIRSMQDSFQAGQVIISSDQNRGLLSQPGTAPEPGPVPVRTSGPAQDAKSDHPLPISWNRVWEGKQPWGVATAVDLYGCDPGVIRDAGMIQDFVVQLCERIDMRRFGDCQVVHFGDEDRVAGYSMTQLIETSLISGHFANATHAGYLDIFSCKFYEPREVAEFAMAFFKADHYKLQISLRQ